MLDQAVNIAVVGIAVTILLVVLFGDRLKGLFAGGKLPQLPSLPVPDLSHFAGASDTQLEQAGFAALQTLDHVLAHSSVAAADRKKLLDPVLQLVMCHREPAANQAAGAAK